METDQINLTQVRNFLHRRNGRDLDEGLVEVHVGFLDQDYIFTIDQIKYFIIENYDKFVWLIRNKPYFGYRIYGDTIRIYLKPQDVLVFKLAT